MKTYTQEELKEILANHKLWLDGNPKGKRADLSCADLRSANLRYANLRSADLRSADLSCANLRSANLSSADLRSADLSYADLSSADLSYSDLRSSNLRLIKSLQSTIGNNINIKALQTNNWVVTYTDTEIQIGCQQHTIKKWLKFDDEEISSMDSKALDWWKEWKPIIKKIIKISPCEPTGYIEKVEEN